MTARRAASIQTVQSLAARVAELKQAAPAPLTDQLALCLAADLAEAWMRLPAPGPDPPSLAQTPLHPNLHPNLNPDPSPEPAPAEPLQRVKALCPFLALLRRGDHSAERLQIRRQWLDLATQKLQHHLAAQKARTDPAHRSLRPDGGFTKETIEKLAQDLNLF